MKYGLQMYSVRDLTEHDLRGALQQVAEMGYSFVEFAGFMGNSAEDVKNWLEEYGLQVSSTHTPLAELEDEVLDQTIAYHKAIGCKDIIIPYAKLETKEQIDAFVERVNTLIPKLQAEGISLHYHNHDCDFAPTPEGLVPEEELLARIKEGDEEAKDRYIKGNLRLVLSVIKRFSASSENPDDLFQIGCIGLIKAVNNFNTDLDVKFSTYAVPMIIGEIRRYMRDNNSIRVSRSLRDTAYKAIYARESYMKQHLKEPTVQEIAREIGISGEDIVFALDAIQAPVSLQEPVYSDGGDALYVMDQISDKKNREEKWIEDLSLEAAMDHLSSREQYIIRLRFFEGKTQMEVAEEIQISQAQVSRLEKHALKVMRQYLNG